MKNLILLICIIGFSNYNQAQQNDVFQIIIKPIKYDTERKQLSIEYLENHHGLIQNEPTIIPKMIVLHYTAGGTLTSNFNYFNNTHIENSITFNKKQSKLNVSSHYLIDRDGTIYQIIPDTLFARHTIGLNYCAIGVENIGSKKQPLTEKQVKANAFLIRKLAKKYNIEYVIGHYEYGKFRNSKIWKELDPKYFTGKEDPGENFMFKVRELISDLKLKKEL